MSRVPLVLTVAALAGCVTPLDPALFDAFSKGRDVTDYLIAEQLDEVPSGNAILGQAGLAAESQRVSASLRVGRASRSMPTLTGTTLAETGSRPSTLPTADASATTATIDVALPLIRGFSVGATRILSVQLLGSATVSGDYQSNDLAASRGAIRFGYGTRIGLLAETEQLPAISYSSVRRTLPSLTWEDRGVPTDQGNDATIRMHDFSGHVVSRRIAASKTFGRFGATMGWGRDELESHYTLTATVSGSTPHSESQGGEAGGHRSVVFAGGSYAVHRDVAVAAELSRTTRLGPGYQANSIGAAGDQTRTALTVGVRVGGRRGTENSER